MSNCIVSVDENGQPYLAHAGENGGWKNRATKYLGKFPNLYGNGKTAYAYTQQQLQAMQNYARGGARKAQNAVNNLDQARRTLKSDLKKRKTMKEAQKEAADPKKTIAEVRDKKTLGDVTYKYRIQKSDSERAYDKAFAEATKKTYDKTKLGKAENAAKEAVNNVKSKTDRMKEEFRKKKDDVKDAVDKIKDKAGVDEKERYEEAQKAYDENDLNEKILAAEKSPKYRAFWDYDSEMFKKYGQDYKSKMSKSEKEKYSKLDADLTDIAEKHWEAFKNKYSAPTGNDPTLKDQLDKAKAEYDSTLLGRLDRIKKK